MLYFDNTLYLEIADIIKCGIRKNENTIYKDKSTGVKWANFTKHPVYKNIVLIEYESLAPAKKKLVIDCFGNPYEHFAKEPIRQMVVRDLKAEAFFLERKLPTDPKNNIVEKYTIAASWLNMLIKTQDDFRQIKKDLGISAGKFWLTIGEMIQRDNIDLPANHIRLKQKIDVYRELGYDCLIHKQFGNSNSKKVDDEVCESLLLELISQPNTDDVKTCNQYNKWAVKNEKSQITKRTVCSWRLRHDYLIRAERFGTSDNYNTYGKIITRKRPSAPLLLVEHDDNALDLYFQNPPKAKVYYFNRFVIAVVIDAFNDYPLGWAMAETYTKDLIRFAYLDAVYHIRQLTGGWYLPHQIRSDRFGIDKELENDLARFYQSLAIFTPAAVKVPRGKYIERSFGTTWHQVLSTYKNYAGNNIISKHHVSQDFIDANKKNYPTKDQAPEQAFHFINILRHRVNEKTGQSIQEEWIRAFNASAKSKQHEITELQVLAKLGTPHTHTNTITNRGITPAINCVERTYEIPNEYYLETVGKTVQVIYDPMDYSRILVTDFKSILFIAREQELMPSAIADFEPGDRAKLNDRLQQKRDHMLFIAAKKKDRREVLERKQIDVESLLMAGIHTKAESHGILMDYSPVPIEAPKQKRLTAASRPRTVEDMLRQM
ncbi:MAG: hypothetical protein ACT4OJ_04275 [Bacteroidota bacterium]